MFTFFSHCSCFRLVVGGGNPESPASAPGGGGGTSPTLSIAVINGSGVSTNSISAVEIAQAKVTLKDANGLAINGVVVTFSEIGAGLITISPASKTVLTDASGQASVEFRASNPSTSIGATTITSSATVAGQSVSANKSIGISSAPTTGTVTDKQLLANAINFLDVNPADKSIVLKGSGGNGRSESATLRFRVVDQNNTPVQGTTVTFSANPPSDVTLNITNATSDADGVVITTVSSKSVATAVVIEASVDTRTISTQSDQLLVTTGVITQAGFDLSATKYNMNFGITGDSSVITVSIVDINGNRVADGVPVVFTATHGAVGTSSKGGCTTLNGACTVIYTVQDPRPVDGVRARVTASSQVSNGTPVSDFLDLTVSNLSLANLYSAATGGAIVNTVNSTALPNPCKFTFDAFVGTAAGFPTPAGTTIEVKGTTPDFAASVITGSPVLDLAQQRTPVTIQFDASSTTLVPACVTGTSTTTATGNVEVKFTAGTRVTTLATFVVTYPK